MSRTGEQADMRIQKIQPAILDVARFDNMHPRFTLWGPRGRINSDKIGNVRVAPKNDVRAGERSEAAEAPRRTSFSPPESVGAAGRFAIARTVRQTIRKSSRRIASALPSLPRLIFVTLNSRREDPGGTHTSITHDCFLSKLDSTTSSIRRMPA
jgi:hypothetical protein